MPTGATTNLQLSRIAKRMRIPYFRGVYMRNALPDKIHKNESGFCEDYKRIVINARHELVLIRSRNDNNCLVGRAGANPTIELLKIQWRMPHVSLSEVNKLSFLRTLESGRYLSVCFRSWDLYEFPLLQNTTKHSWAVKAATQLEKPRYVIFALQTGRKNVLSKNATQFDACKLTNVRLHLNSDFYPYDDMNLDFDRNRYAILYNMYARFRKAYYGQDDTYLDIDEFSKAVVWDVLYKFLPIDG
ncbi:uncharacterized protein [Linepithema humile]|uniref:uncharacterized protein n=1 Tax=Linepithema humile TaxID=83485 RepID=UPI00351F7D83